MASRTVGMGMVSRALRLAARCEQAGISTEQALAQRELARPSRRAVLGAGLAWTASGAVTACGAGLAARSRRDLRAQARIVVVGAGLAGLTAAHRLAQQGFRPRVFDANDRVGGRTFSARELFATKCELGGELIDTNHAAIRQLCGELGVRLIDREQDGQRLARESYVFAGRAHTEEEIVTLLRPIAAALQRELAVVGGMDEQGRVPRSPALRTLDQISLAAWLDRQGVQGVARSLIDVAFTAECGLEIDAQSSLNLLFTLDPVAPPVRLYGESDERFCVRDGSDAIATALARRLPVPVALGHALLAVRARGDGALIASFAYPGGTLDVVADRLVLAVPFTTLRRVALEVPLPPTKRRAIAALRYGTNSKLMIGTRARPWRAMQASGTAFCDAGFQECWDSSRGFAATGAAVTSFAGGRFGLALGDGTAEAQGARFASALDAVFPGSAAAYDGRAARFHWPAARWFGGSYACYGPGDLTDFGDSEGEAAGRIHFAGEHTSPRFRGFMNGAVDSGERVAREIARLA